jgi:hypothetical protein
MDAAGTCSAYGGEVAMARRCTRLFALELPQPGATLVMAAFVTLDCVTCFGACLLSESLLGEAGAQATGNRATVGAAQSSRSAGLIAGNTRAARQGSHERCC